MGKGRRTGVVALGLAWILAAPGPVSADGAGTAAPAAERLLVEDAVDGVSLGEWTARWWQWSMAQWFPPYLDPDGRLCELGQKGPVWFLAGTDGSFNAMRSCTVPLEAHLLVPLINMVQYQPRGRTRSCEELQKDVAVNNDHLASAVVLLDGQPLGDLRAHRVRSEGCFRLDPDDPSSPLAAADGYWLMLRPLSPGRHTLVVGANYDAGGDADYRDMHQTFEYALDVGGPVF